MKPTILITSGPTREYIDPVRYISNASSGKMGSALANAALKKAAKVIVISGPASIKYPKNIKLIEVVSAKEMFAEAKKNFPKADIIIGAAAVSDFRPSNPSNNKIKKSDKLLKIKLTQNPDILKELGSKKDGKVLTGFALETKDLLNSAKKKLLEKNLDLIVANSPDSIGSDSSQILIIDRSGKILKLKGGKNILSKRIIDESIRIWKNNKTC